VFAEVSVLSVLSVFAEVSVLSVLSVFAEVSVFSVLSVFADVSVFEPEPSLHSIRASFNSVPAELTKISPTIPTLAVHFTFEDTILHSMI